MSLVNVGQDITQKTNAIEVNAELLVGIAYHPDINNLPVIRRILLKIGSDIRILSGGIADDLESSLNDENND